MTGSFQGYPDRQLATDPLFSTLILCFDVRTNIGSHSYESTRHRTMKPTPAKLLADLVWVVNSPSLIESDAEVTPLAKTEVELDRLVLFFDAAVPRRVGLYFERLVLFWLVHVRGVEMVANGMPIREGKITLGELDFLFRDELNRLTHLEVAVKFYLYRAETLIEGSHFVGPNLKDTFERKMKRMFEHQLPLSHDHVEGVDVREAMVKGRVFYATSDCQPIELPTLMSADHLRCRWVRRSDFEAAPRNDAIRYRVVAKPFWLSVEVDAGNESGLLNQREIGAWLGESAKRSERPVLIDQLEESQGCWSQVERFFVVPNGWPDKPKESDGD